MSVLRATLVDGLYGQARVEAQEVDKALAEAGAYEDPRIFRQISTASLELPPNREVVFRVPCPCRA